MSKPFPSRDLQFYLTAPGPCPYLPGRRERKVFTHLSGSSAPDIADALAHAGFRRSQSLVYRPACEACDQCLSLRVRVQDFQPSRSQRRIIKRNQDLKARRVANNATQEQYDLISRYLDSRHGDGGMAGLSFEEYAVMTGDSPCDTAIVEYRQSETGALIAALITDRMSDGTSLVYSFFEPEEASRSLGSFMIADQIRQAAEAGLAYAYLGYWVKDSVKMDYKARFRPAEVLRRSGWTQLSDADTKRPDGA